MSRFFDQFNTDGAPCPLCDTYTEGAVLLNPIPNTEEGNNMQAKQVHKECAAALAFNYLAAIEEEGRHVTVIKKN